MLEQNLFLILFLHSAVFKWMALPMDCPYSIAMDEVYLDRKRNCVFQFNDTQFNDRNVAAAILALRAMEALADMIVLWLIWRFIVFGADEKVELVYYGA